MPLMQELVVGYDLRDCSDAWLSSWQDANRRRVYLIRSDIAAPASVDSMVWPTLTAGLDPQWTGPVGKSWDDIGRVAKLYRSRVSSPTPEMCAVMITLADNSDDKHWGEVESVVNSNWKSLSGWSLMGYDVADRSLLSGLTNCGIEANRSKWAERLNKSHLFDDVNAAMEYRAFVDRIVLEHAPFEIYALYRRNDIPAGS